MRSISSWVTVAGIRLSSIVALALAAMPGAAVAQDITEPAVAADVGIQDPLAVQEQPAPEDQPAVEEPLAYDEEWKIHYRRYNSWQGPVGGLRLVDPSTGAEGSVRFQLGVDIFSDKSFLSDKDEVDQLGENLAISWTAIEHLEVYGSVYNNSTTVNQRDYTSDDEDERVENDYHSIGDAVVGIKSGAWVSEVVSLGGDLGMMLPNKAGAVGVLFEGIGVRLRGGLLADFRNTESRVPLLGRFNLSYLFDHTEMLVDDTEKERYSNLATVPEPEKEMRHLITRAERFGLGINRVDQLGFGLGLELPLEAATDFYLQPLLEWQWGLPVNRRDYLCPAPAPEGYAGMPEDFEDDSCLKKEGAKAFPMTLDLAIRVVPPVRGLSALAGVEFGLTGTSHFVRELAPTTPYRVLLAVGYDYDARPGKVQMVEKQVEVAEKAPPEGRVTGVITVQGKEEPVAGAAVSFAGHEELSAVQSGEDGRFTSYPFPAGSQVAMQLSHPRFEPAFCSALIPAQGGDTEAHCWMSQLPDTGEIKGRVVDQWGSPVPGARVELTGPTAVLAVTDENGAFQQQAQAGEYSMRVDADGYLTRASSLTLASRGSASPEVTLSARPSPSRVSLKGNQIRITGSFKFMPNSSELEPSASAVIAELADLLLRNPQISRIRIEGPNPGPAGDGIMALNRAVAIKQRLAAAGVSVDRIDAVGGNTASLKITFE